jgi:antitoxin FitA
MCSDFAALAPRNLDICRAGEYHFCMSKTIQLRNVPDALHRALEVKAALEGMSLSNFLIREAKAIAARPTMEEMRQRLLALPPVKLEISSAEIIREMRGR